MLDLTLFISLFNGDIIKFAGFTILRLILENELKYIKLGAELSGNAFDIFFLIDRCRLPLIRFIQKLLRTIFFRCVKFI